VRIFLFRTPSLSGNSQRVLDRGFAITSDKVMEAFVLGLMREEEGIAAGVLESLGANMQKVRAHTLLVLDRIHKIFLPIKATRKHHLPKANRTGSEPF
jgi:Clp amino terminal domain, pathogenicity island component